MRTPLAWTYVDAHMDRQCPNCHAPAHEYCRRPDGPARRIPCIKRMNRPGNAVQGVVEQIRDIRAPAREDAPHA